LSSQKVLKLHGDVQNYSFSDLKIHSATVPKDAAREYEFKQFENTELNPKQLDSENKNAREHSFSLNEDVKNHRGSKLREEEIFEVKLNDILSIRLSEIRKSSEEIGYQKGFDQGKEEAREEMTKYYEEQIHSIKDLVESVVEQRNAMFEKYRQEIVQMVLSITKWLIHKEIDAPYIDKMIEHMVHQLDERQNLIVKLDKKTFEQRQDLILIIKEKFPDIKNLKFDYDDKLSHPGVSIESDGLFINGSLEAQMKVLDKMFLEMDGLK